MRTVRIPDEALAVLSACTVHGGSSGGAEVRIVAGQLDRKLYEAVNRVLVEIGGKWNTKAKAHLFTTAPDPTTERLDGVILSGEITPLSKNGYFPTPKALADRLVELADLKRGQRILEPSAGSGALIDAAIRTLTAQVDAAPIIATTIRAIEVNPQLSEAMRMKYEPRAFILNECMDFLQWGVDGDEYLYDRAIMNPPFENRADARHVLYAYSLLKPGGRLVSIMASSVKFRREKEYELVRTLIEDCGEIIDLPAASFKESGTLVSTVLIALDKEAA